jgi:hypothetical protein
MSASQNSHFNPLRTDAPKLLENATNAGFRNLMSLRNLAQAETALAVTQYRITVNTQRRTTDLPSFQPRPPHSCLDPFHNRLPLDLSYRANDYDHSPAKRTSCVDVFSQADELDAEVVKFIEHFQEMAHISRNPVERGHENNVEAVPPRIRQKLVETGALRFRPGDCVRVLADDLVVAVLCHLTQVEKLSFQMLVVRAYAGIQNGSFHVFSSKEVLALSISHCAGATMGRRSISSEKSKAFQAFGLRLSPRSKWSRKLKYRRVI